MSKNCGHEIAMTAGMDNATKDAVIFMDADLQHPPRYIPDMIKAWQKGSDIVLTKRLENKETSFFYNLSATLFYRILNFLSDVKIPAKTPDFRLIDKSYVEVLKKFKEHDRLFRGILSLIISDKNVKFIDFIAPFARDHGITICIENLYDGKGGHLVEGPGCDARKAVERIDYINEKYGAEVLGFCFDTGHANLVGIDFETLYSQRVSACSVGMVKFVDGKKTDSYYSLIKPPFDYPGKCGMVLTHIHGFTEDSLKNERTFDEILPEMESE